MTSHSFVCNSEDYTPHLNLRVLELPVQYSARLGSTGIQEEGTSLNGRLTHLSKKRNRKRSYFSFKNRPSRLAVKSLEPQQVFVVALFLDHPGLNGFCRQYDKRPLCVRCSSCCRQNRKCLHVGNWTYNSSHCMSGTRHAARKNITSETWHAVSNIKCREPNVQ